ncbi:hypothetical protein MLD38_012232 [Melastoma candidum]|uniref:Uncharacterized protein n=1 Tax=Melastoma candidum TaxID=119954 RepID=A0ACB9R7G0_9MYRT|nr:hypothetical protein MLD38_012232 [Melastoma candidum]
MKKQKLSSSSSSSSSFHSDRENSNNPFDALSDEIVFLILDHLLPRSLDAKSFSLVCKSFYSIESLHRRHLRPLRTRHLPSVLSRYPNLSRLDLSLCPRVSDSTLDLLSSFPSVSPSLRSIDLSRSRFFTSSGLSSLALRCSNLVDVDVSNATDMRDAGAAALAQAKNLERLRMTRCKMVTDIGIGCVAVGCRKLKELVLKWCLGVGDLGVGLVAVKCKELRTLDVSYLPISNKCVPSIVKLPYLEDLFLEGCYGIDDDGLAVLKDGCNSLKTLDISSCQSISHVGIPSIGSGYASLKHLNLSYGIPVTPTLADGLKKLSMLQTLKLDGCMVTISGLKALGDCCASLTEISLSKCAGVTDEGLSFLVTKHGQLKKFDLTCCRKITEVSIAHITRSCTALTSLRMESCTLVPKEAFMLIGQRCAYLEELDLTENEIDDEGLEYISRCTRIRVLKLGICLDITDKGLSCIGASCPELIELDLYRSAGVTDTGISSIARGCPNLEMINVAYCNGITDTSLAALSKCSSLNTLECRGCPLVTSVGISAVAVSCRQLTKLDIKKCGNIDDSGMIPLARHSQNLRQINLSYTSVTDVGLLSLASVSCLQSMTILHLKGLTASGLAAALLACGGLTKVKLQTLFRSKLPHLLLNHLEARGCTFHWRNKVFQVEVDAKCWKLQIEDDNTVE